MRKDKRPFDLYHKERIFSLNPAKLPRYPVVWLIRLYQKTISPDHGWFRQRFEGGYCRYYPTCSEYGRQAIERYGLIKGIPKTAWRIMRCNPWSDGGVDRP